MWSLAFLALLIASVSWGIWQSEALAARMAAWTDSAPDSIAIVLGWAPAGGFSILLAALLLWRWRRLVRGPAAQRPIDLLAIAAVTMWLGLTAAFMPSRRGGEPGDFEELIAIPGSSFARSAEWSVRGFSVSLVLAIVTVIAVAWRRRDDVEGDRRFGLVVLPWLAAAIGLPPAVVLIGLIGGTV